MSEAPSWSWMLAVSGLGAVFIVGLVQLERYDLAVGTLVGLAMAWALRLRDAVTGGEQP